MPVAPKDLLIAHRMSELSMHWLKVWTSGPRHSDLSNSNTVGQIGEEREQLVAVWVEQEFHGFIGAHAPPGVFSNASSVHKQETR